MAAFKEYEAFELKTMVGTATKECKRLENMGFVFPFVGHIVTASCADELGLWISEPDQNNELRSLAAELNTRHQPLFSEGWAYGISRGEELLAAADPLEAIIEATYHTETIDGPSGNLHLILGALYETSGLG